MGLSEHKAAAPPPSTVRVAIISVSDTRTRETDEGGALVEALAREAGLTVSGREILPDQSEVVRARVHALTASPFDVASPSDVASGSVGDAGAAAASRPHVILLTGGTGLAPRDGTLEAIAPLLTRTLDGFGELFRMLSFAEIGAAAMLSRACAGIAGGDVAVFSMPGSLPAIRLAMQRLILPELGHLIAELHRRPLNHNASAEHPHH